MTNDQEAQARTAEDLSAVPAWAQHIVNVERAAREKRRKAATEAGHPEWGDLPAGQPHAKAAGVTRYFTGNPCDRGHVAPRTAASRECMECRRLREHLAYQAGR